MGEGSLLALVVIGHVELNLERGELELASYRLDRAARHAAAAGDEIGGVEVRRLPAFLALKRADYQTARRQAEEACAAAKRTVSSPARPG